jgi:hypothetical protein
VLSFKGHIAGVRSIAFSPDNERVLTGGWDRAARLWEVQSGRELLTLRIAGSPVFSVAFSPNNLQVFTGVWEETGRLWLGATPEQVAVWRTEEQGAARLGSPNLARPSAGGTRGGYQDGAIRKWLIFGPLSIGVGETETQALNSTQLSETNMRPRFADRARVNATEQFWQPVQLENDVIDFEAVFGIKSPHCVAYAVCYIRAPRAYDAVQLMIGSDDQAKVFLNDTEIYRCESPRGYIPDQDRVQDQTLRAGLNTLVFKVVNETLDWKGSVRITDTQGKPLPDVSIEHSPD